LPAAIGPIFFAWVDPEETTFGPEHMRCDEQIVRFNRELAENSFGKVMIDIRNPREGPLAPGRKVWAWLAWDSGAGVKELLFGQLVAVPTNLLNEVITFVLIARPRDWVDQRDALADSLRILPYYDEIFVDAAYQDDPDVVLDGYSAVYHAHHTTHVVTISDFLVGEAGLITFDESKVVRPSVNISVDRAPLRAVTVNGEIPWTQQSSAVINFGTKHFSSYTGESLLSGWPKTGDSLAGGYYVISASAIDDTGLGSIEPISWNVTYTNRQEKHRDGDLMSFNETFSGPSNYGPKGGTTLSEYSEGVVGDPATGTPASFSFHRTALAVPRWGVTTTLVLGVDANRDRKENVSLTVTSDLQAVLQDPDDESTVETIDLPAVDVAKECDTSGAVIEDTSRSEYISTDRGLQSIEYMIMRARAKLILGSRVVKVKWDCSFADAVDVTTRHNARIFDPRLPGGEAVGKVISTSLRRDGGSGEFRGTIEIACAVGHGNAITTSAGTPDYVDADALDPGIQTYTGQVVAAASGDVGFSPPILTHGGGGMFDLSTLVVRAQEMTAPGEVTTPTSTLSSFPPLAFTNSGFFAEFLLKQHEAAVRNMAENLSRTQTWFELELKNLAGPGIEADWSVDIGPLVIPRQIDLEAGSTI
jgi:hypothetical protein